MKRLYLSGGITNVSDFRKRFDDAKLRFSSYCEVINPAEVNRHLPDKMEHGEYMHVCFAMMDLCDYIYMLKGWEESKGACMEYGYAKAKGMEILYEEDKYERVTC